MFCFLVFSLFGFTFYALLSVSEVVLAGVPVEGVFNFFRRKTIFKVSDDMLTEISVNS